jgi:hypothetical protein
MNAHVVLALLSVGHALRVPGQTAPEVTPMQVDTAAEVTSTINRLSVDWLLRRSPYSETTSRP